MILYDFIDDHFSSSLSLRVVGSFQMLNIVTIVLPISDESDQGSDSFVSIANNSDDKSFWNGFRGRNQKDNQRWAFSFTFLLDQARLGFSSLDGAWSFLCRCLLRCFWFSLFGHGQDIKQSLVTGCGNHHPDRSRPVGSSVVNSMTQSNRHSLMMVVMCME
jgi:hypothetical protein